MVVMVGGLLHNSYRVIQTISRTVSVTLAHIFCSSQNRVESVSLTHVPLYSKTFAAPTINDTPPRTHTHTHAHMLQSFYPGQETVACSTLCTSDGTFIILIINTSILSSAQLKNIQVSGYRVPLRQKLLRCSISFQALLGIISRNIKEFVHCDSSVEQHEALSR